MNLEKESAHELLYVKFKNREKDPQPPGSLLAQPVKMTYYTCIQQRRKQKVKLLH